MDTNDFLRIIDEFEPETFERCKLKLYDTLRFRVLKPSEIRPCDMKERLVHYFNTNTAANSTKSFTEVRYALYLASVLKTLCGENAVHDKYSDMFLKCIDTVRDMSADINTLDKLVLVYCSRLRGIAKIGTCAACNVDYYIYPSDLETADYVLNSVDVRERKEKKGIKFKKEKEYTEVKFNEHEKRFLYIITVLLIYRILQYEEEI